MHHSEVDQFKVGLGGRIKKLREDKKLGVREFALFVDIKHHQLIIIEKGRVGMRVSTLRKITGAFSITLSEIVDY